MNAHDRPSEYQFFRQRLSLSLSFLLLLQYFSPLSVALANPQLYSKSGAGVSSTPLNVMSFDTPEFGEIRDAINLANGNLYLDAGEVSRNDKITSTDNNNSSQTGLLGNWNLKSRLKLVNANGVGFSSGWTGAAGNATGGWSPASITSQVYLEVGDGSRQTFSRIEHANLPGDAPTWIKKRYASATGVAFYRSIPEVGNDIPDTWVVFVRTTSGTYAHHYDLRGNRSTFHKDGAYLDYVQTPNQQYRSASRVTSPDSEGDMDVESNVSPRTEVNYVDTTTTGTPTTHTPTTTGKIDFIKDEWGRVTDYTWNTDGTLSRIEYKYNGSTIIRKTEFGYLTQGGLKLISTITYTTWNGKDSTFSLNSSRTFNLKYESKTFTGLTGSFVVLTGITRRITKSSGSTSTPANWTSSESTQDTTYAYKVFGTTRKFYAVSDVTKPGREIVSYNYLEGQGKEGGMKVTITQKDQSSEYLYDLAGRLRERRVLADQPAIPGEAALTNQWLNWKYEYYNSGQVALEVAPSAIDGSATGTTTHFAYDSHGNLIRRNTYTSYTMFLEDQDVLRLKLLALKVDGSDSANSYYSGDTAVIRPVLENDTKNLGVTWEIKSQAAFTMPKLSELGKGSSWMFQGGYSGTPIPLSQAVKYLQAGSTPGAIRINRIAETGNDDRDQSLQLIRAGGMSPGLYQVRLKARVIDPNTSGIGQTGALSFELFGNTHTFPISDTWTTITFNAENTRQVADRLLSLKAFGLDPTGNFSAVLGGWEFDELTITPLNTDSVLTASPAAETWFAPSSSRMPRVTLDTEGLPSYQSALMWTVQPKTTSTTPTSGFLVPIPYKNMYTKSFGASFWVRSLGSNFNLKTSSGSYQGTTAVTGSWQQVVVPITTITSSGGTTIFSSLGIVPVGTGNIPFQIYDLKITRTDEYPYQGLTGTVFRWNPDALMASGNLPDIIVGTQGDQVYTVTPNTTTGTYGLQTSLNIPKGKYTLSYEVKADAAMELYHAVGTQAPVKTTVGTSWQTVNSTINLADAAPVAFKLYQNSTTRWSLRNLRLRYLDGRVIQLPRGTGAYALKVIATAVANPDQKAEVNVAVTSKVTGVHIATPEGDVPLPLDATSKEKAISVRYYAPAPESLSDNPQFDLQATVSGTADANKKLRWYTSGGTITPNATDSTRAIFKPPAWVMSDGGTQQFDVVAVSEDNPNEWYKKTVEVRYFGFKLSKYPVPYMKSSNWMWGFPNGYPEPHYFQYQLEVNNVPPAKLNSSGQMQLWMPTISWSWMDDWRDRAAMTDFGCMRPGEVNWYEGGDPATPVKIYITATSNRVGLNAEIQHTTEHRRSGQETGCSFPFELGKRYNNGIFWLNGRNLMENDLWKTVIPQDNSNFVYTDPTNQSTAYFREGSSGVTRSFFDRYTFLQKPTVQGTPSSGDDKSVTLDPSVYPQVTDFSDKEHVNWLTKTQFVYDQDNNLIQTHRPASNIKVSSGQSVMFDPDYQALSSTNELTFASKTTNGQEFAWVSSIKTSERIGGQALTVVTNPSSVISQVGGVEKRVTTSVFNATNGLPESVKLAWGTSGTAVRTTTFSYHSIDSTTAQYSTAAVSNPLWSGTRDVDQLPFLVKTQVVKDNASNQTLEHEFVYDEFGNVVQEKALSALMTQLPATNTTAPTFTHHFNQRTFNGFNQIVWQGKKAEGSSGYDTESFFNYANNGDLLSSWAGLPSNATSYHFNTNGVVDAVAKGVPTDGTQDRAGSQNRLGTQPVAVTHDLVENVGLDGFGRPTIQKRFGKLTALVYDSLGRVVQEIGPEGNGTAQHYDFTSQVNLKVKFAGAPTPIAPGGSVTPPNYALATVKLQETWTHHNLGWTITQTRQAKGVAGTVALSTGTLNTGILTTKYAYDEQGRVIQVATEGEDSITEKADQRTSNKFDSEGNLLITVAPALHSKPGTSGLTDKRTPVTVNHYDVLNRKIRTTVLLDSANAFVVTASSTDPLQSVDAASKATTQYVYNGLDRITQTIDAENHLTLITYDPMGNVIRTSRNLWPGNPLVKPSDPDVYSDKSTMVITQAHDAAGRPTSTMDPVNKSSQVKYNALGKVVAQGDHFGFVEKAFTYTGDGLLEATYLPKMSTGTVSVGRVKIADFTSESLDSTFDRVQVIQYNNTPFPAVVGNASMDSLPKLTSGLVDLTAGSVTQYTDYIGDKPKTTILPDKRKVLKEFDEFGNVTRLTDPAGFVTTSIYDPWGHLLEKHELPRMTITDTQQAVVVDADQKAGFTNSTAGLTSTYLYDLFGNLKEKKELELITKYDYNMLGKVVAETRPYFSNAPKVLWKHHVYRLDGTKVVETSHSYFGDLQTPSKFVGVDSTSELTANTQVFSVPLKGNLLIWELDRLGRVIKETSKGVGSDGKSRSEEYKATYVYNGQGLRVRRLFTGDPDIYAQQTNTNINLEDPDFGKLITTSDSPTGPLKKSTTYFTYWHYDQRGLLLKKFDKAVLSDGVTKSAMQNLFSYQYNDNGQETFNSRDVRVYTRTPKSLNGTNAQDASFNDAALMLAATVGKTSTFYNNRGLIDYTTVEDQTPAKEGKVLEATKFTQTTRYAYYLDGQKKTATVNPGKNVGSKRYSYDVMGREVQVVDDLGATNFIPPEPSYSKIWPPEQQAVDKNKFGGRSTITTNYLNFPEVEVTLTSESYNCTMVQKTVPTVGGRVHKTTITQNACGKAVLSAKPDNLITSTTVNIVNVFDGKTGILTNSTVNSTGGAPAQEKFTIEDNKSNSQGDWGIAFLKVTTKNDQGVEVLVENWHPVTSFVRCSSTSSNCGSVDWWDLNLHKHIEYSRHDLFKRDVTVDSNSVSNYSRKSTLMVDEYGNDKTLTTVEDQTSSASSSIVYGAPYGIDNPSNFPSPTSHSERGKDSIALVSDYVENVKNGYGPDGCIESQSPDPADQMRTQNTKTCTRPTVTTVNAKSYTDDGFLKSETGPPEQSTSGTVVTKNYISDSQGKAINFLSSSKTQYQDYLKRYNAEEKVSTFFIRKDYQDVWNHFVNDPMGQQVLSSTGGVFQCNTTSSNQCVDSGNLRISRIVREMNSAYFSGQNVQMIRHRNGEFGYRYEPARKFLWFTLADATVVGTSTYEDMGNAKYHQVKDMTYSLAEGQTDNVKWSGVVVFNQDENTDDPDIENAEVLPLSITHGVSPLEVAAAVTIEPGGNPGNIERADGKSEKPQADSESTEGNGRTVVPQEITKFEHGFSTPVVALSSQSKEKDVGSRPLPNTVNPISNGVSVSDTTIKGTDASDGLDGEIIPSALSATAQVSPLGNEDTSALDEVDPITVQPSTGIPSPPVEDLVPAGNESVAGTSDVPGLDDHENEANPGEIVRSDWQHSGVQPNGTLSDDGKTFCSTTDKTCVDITKPAALDTAFKNQIYQKYLDMKETSERKAEVDAIGTMQKLGIDKNDSRYNGMLIELSIVYSILNQSLENKEYKKTLGEIEQELMSVPNSTLDKRLITDVFGIWAINKWLEKKGISDYKSTPLGGKIRDFLTGGREVNTSIMMQLLIHGKNHMHGTFGKMESARGEYTDRNDPLTVMYDYDTMGLFILAWWLYGSGETLNLNKYFSKTVLGMYLNNAIGDMISQYTRTSIVGGPHPYVSNKYMDSWHNKHNIRDKDAVDSLPSRRCASNTVDEYNDNCAVISVLDFNFGYGESATGYGFIGWASEKVGGLKIIVSYDRNALYKGVDSTRYYNISFQLNDITDPDWKNPQDLVGAVLAELVSWGRAKDFNLVVTWEWDKGDIWMPNQP